MKYNNIYNKDIIYHPTKQFIEKWLRLDSIVFMVDKWHKHIEKVKDSEVITFILVSQLPQVMDVIHGTVSAFIVGKPIILDPPKFLFFDLNAMSSIEAFKQVYDIVKNDLIEKEEYEILLELPSVDYFIGRELED